jgi:cytochrome c oxidase subunit 2
MKRALLIVALCGSGVAYAQRGSATAPTGSAAEAGSAVTGNGGPAPDMQPVDKGQAQGTGPTGAPASGNPDAPPAAAAPAAATPAAATPAAAKPAAATIEQVDCPVKPELVITDAKSAIVPTNGIVQFKLAADIQPDDAKGAGLEIQSGQTKCLRFKSAGAFPFHTSTKQHGTITVKAWFDMLADLPIQESGNFWMPKAVNIAADDSDMMYYVCLGLSAFFFFAIAGAVIYLTIKYRHRPGHKAEPSAAHNDALEVTWTVIPTIIVVFLFWYGWRAYVHVVTPPNKAVEIDVIAWRWNWQFTHTNGVTDSDLHVPVNTPVRLVMTSKDVLHSFYAPAMRVKQDVVPRRYTYAWFEATKPGTYRLTCAEYCGTSHAQMACLETDPNTGACLRRAVVVVHDPGDYERYLNDKASEAGNQDPVVFGGKLYEKKGCVACHTIDGSARVGPSFKQKDWGQAIPLAGGGTVKMDENYIHESLMSPQAKARPGFPPSMPSFEGQLKDKEIQALTAFIKSLKE